jgi:hypothetical protein
MKTKALLRPQNRRGLLQPTTTPTTKEVHARKEPAAAEALPAFTSSPMEAGTPRDCYTTKVVSAAGPRCPPRPPTIDAPNIAALKGPCAPTRETTPMLAEDRSTPPWNVIATAADSHRISTGRAARSAC